MVVNAKKTITHALTRTDSTHDGILVMTLVLRAHIIKDTSFQHSQRQIEESFQPSSVETDDQPAHVF
jgi:hypothetical protein